MTDSRFSTRASERFAAIHGSGPEDVAGLRHLTTLTHKSSTRLVGIYRSDEAAMDDDGGEMAWSTVCEVHGFIIGHRTYKLAFWHASDVKNWCEMCAGERNVACRECGTPNLIPGTVPPSDYRCSKCASWLYDDDDPADDSLLSPFAAEQTIVP